MPNRTAIFLTIIVWSSLMSTSTSAHCIQLWHFSVNYSMVERQCPCFCL